MDTLFLWVSISALALIAAIYFLTKKSRMDTHEKVKAQKVPWTRYPQTNLSVGFALVLLGIVFNTDNRLINYLLIGAGVLVSVAEYIKIKSKSRS
jgi:L-asparagine transporter-like permease